MARNEPMGRLPLPEAQIEAVGTALGCSLDARSFARDRTFWLRTLNLSASELSGLGNLSEADLVGLDLPSRNPALFKKLKALVELVKHYPVHTKPGH